MKLFVEHGTKLKISNDIGSIVTYSGRRPEVATWNKKVGDQWAQDSLKFDDPAFQNIVSLVQDRLEIERNKDRYISDPLKKIREWTPQKALTIIAYS